MYRAFYVTSLFSIFFFSLSKKKRVFVVTWGKEGAKRVCRRTRKESLSPHYHIPCLPVQVQVFSTLCNLMSFAFSVKDACGESYFLQQQRQQPRHVCVCAAWPGGGGRERETRRFVIYFCCHFRVFMRVYPALCSYDGDEMACRLQDSSVSKRLYALRYTYMYIYGGGSTG